MINIVHILEDFSFLSGGLRTMVNNLHNRLKVNNVNSIIITTRKEVDDDIILAKGGNIVWRYSSDLKGKLKGLHLKGKVDIIHIHGVWMYPQYAAAKFSYKNNIPFLISCHGMYEPWLWSKGGFKKRIYFKNVVKRVFSKANYIHAITSPEKNELKKLFQETKIIEIPNLIEASTSKTEGENNFTEKYILYLGRIDEKKGIDLLIKAFYNLRVSDFKLKIAGAFNNFSKELETLVEELQIEEKVEFLGLVVGKEKENLFRNAFIFVAPSYSEVVGMVNLEAAIFKTPVITTHQTGLKKEWSNNGGFLVNPNVEDIENALKSAVKWSIDERNKNGEKLYAFVRKEYSWEHRFNDWIKLYESML